MAKKKVKISETKIKPVPAPQPETGLDTNKNIINDIVSAAQVGSLDISSIDALNNSAQSREQTYELLDAMAQDDVVSAVLETYTEDTVQTNDAGKAIWVESSDSNVLNYTSWLMDSLNIDKHLYQWAYCLVTYGDCYVRLYRRSDYGDDLLFQNNKHNKKLNEATSQKDPLNEDVKLQIYEDDDPYVPYVEMVANPGEMFDLQKFGKCYGYIQAPIRVVQKTTDELYNYLTRYKMKQRDVNVYDATCFAHASLENTSQRQPETVDVFMDDLKVKDDDDSKNENTPTTSYSIKRGQSILYNSFRIWRELNLLEMSALLNRITQSSVVRIVNIDATDMPKENVQNFIQRLKDKIEQKTALNDGIGMTEFNNPAPIINTIYVPKYGEQGGINVTTLGGDFDPKSLTDIEYFRDKLFGSLKVPKQFFGFTEDGAGFNGGTSLTIISSRYGKTIKKIQSILCQMVTDIINLFLIDRGLSNYVNKFTVKMQTPVTQEEIDRRTNTDNHIRYVSELMGQMNDIDDKLIKLKIYKSLLGNVVSDAEVMTYLQQYIDKLETGAKESNNNNNEPKKTPASEEPEAELPSAEDLGEMTEEVAEEDDEDDDDILNEDTSEDEILPTADSLGFDALNNKEIEKE